MREGRAILLVALVEFSATAGGIVGKGHVPCRLKPLVARAVELAAQAPGLGVVEPCSVIPEVEDKPELEARVGDGEFDAVGAGLPDCFLESGMVSRPLDIEHAPELINLRILVHGSPAGLDGHSHQSPGYGPALPGLNTKIDGGHVPH